MIVQCENCQTNFSVNETLIKSEGSKVKCSRCGSIFKTYPPEQIEDEAPAIDSSIQEEPNLKPTEPEPEMEIEIDSEDSEPEMDLDFDDSFEDDIMEDIEDLETEYREDPDGFGDEDLEIPSEGVAEVTEEEIEEEQDSLTPVFEKKKQGKSHTLLILILIILGLAGGAFAVYKYAPDLIPSYILPEKKSAGRTTGFDVGARRLEILTVDGSFVNSNKVGRLFVISGKVRNSYPKGRDFIQVKGCILDDKGQIVMEKEAFAGNVMEMEEFVNLSLEEIGAVLKNRHGIEKKNVNVKSGATIDFMIVFEKLPDNLSEFTVGAVSSSPHNPEPNTQN